jgi:2-polyprenyl-3-methyl-5-hydroxy-6-metoxy-1,4-benzoquinol methylase
MKEETHKSQVQKGERFEFGKNWKAFLSTLTQERIEIAKQSLIEMLGYEDLTGKTFLDVGCGSGLFSLAAMKLGADVYSFDFDLNSVKCTEILKERYFSQSKWVISEGSILDQDYIKSLGTFDIVYSWGVLHHTGNMNRAFDNIDIMVKHKGNLFIAIYNDEGHISVRWRKVKKLYNSGFFGKALVVSTYIPYFVLRLFFSDLKRFKNPFKRYKDYKTERGMSRFYDWFDWLGGLPFEVATPEYVFEHYKKKNYTLLKLKTRNRSGCNEFVFQKN